MRIVILGAGVIGVTSAYYLAKAGHKVTVLDRQSGPALETSFGNAGEISPGYASPWAAPGIPQKAMKWLFMKHAPLIIQPMLDMSTWRWVTAMLRNCTSSRYALNKSRMVRLAEYSRDCLISLREDTGIEYDHRTQGTLQLFRYQKQLDGMAKDIEVLQSDGVPFEVLDASGCVAAEPGLAPVREKVAGGLRLPNDETGDCFKFTNELAKLAEGLGVEFRFGVKLEGLRQQGNRIVAVSTSEGEVEADMFVGALGSFTPAFVKPLGLKVPVYPVKGYSITVHLDDERSRNAAPWVSLLDDRAKIVTSRLGEGRFRVAGTAEFNGMNRDIRDDRVRPLVDWTRMLFPGIDTNRVVPWAGLRPMMPNMMPRVGKGRKPGVFYNTGHGHLGWTLSAATAQMVAETISGEFGLDTAIAA